VLSLWSVRRVLKDSARQIETALHRDGTDRLIVRSGIGAGRHTLAKDLAEQLGAHVVEFPPYEDLDSPLHGLVQLAGATGALGAPGAGHTGLLAQALGGARLLADANRPVVLLIPAPLGPGSDTDLSTPAEIDDIVRSVGSVPRLRVIVLATTAHRAEWFEAAMLTLTTPNVGAADLDPQQLPDRFAHAAAELQRWMSATGWASTPIEARLQVGLIAMGDRPAALAVRLEALARKMAAQLTKRFRTIGSAVRRLLVARRPLPVPTVAKISGIESDWLPLLTTCIGYGDAAIRVSEVTRQVLLDALDASAEELESAHEALADYHAGLDGAPSLRGLGRDAAVSWLEKIHHLALGGDACAARWAAHEHAGREQIWERARFLSRVKRRHADAAELYRSCIERFGQDGYSMHYLAYNLERSHQSLGEVRTGYELAVRADPANPWWQQRWVRFLIAHGTLEEARGAWRLARQVIDPDGELMRRNPWLAIHLHGMVARRWLALGRIDDARDVLAEIPKQWLDQEAELRDLVRALSSDEQARTLGESVYPSSTPIEDRWTRPRSLRPSRGGKRLSWWAPGRVVEATADEVTVVIAPTPTEAQQVTYDAVTWRRMASELASDAEGYFELGRYEGGDEVIRTSVEDMHDRWLEDETSELRGWVRAWPR
jgi:tetratricopeptide (TPR) repeat protein